MTTLIKTFSDNDNFSNAIVPLTIDISEVIFIYSHNVENKKLNACKEVIQRNKNIKITFLHVKENDVDNLIKDDCIIDVSARQYLSLVLFEKALKKNNEIIYFNGQDKKIISYKDHKVYNNTLFNLSITDLIKLGGGTITTNMHKPITNRKAIELIYRLVDENSNKYSELVYYLGKVNSMIAAYHTGKLTYKLSDTVVDKIENDYLYSKFQKYNLFSIDGTTLSFPNEEIQEIFNASGALLENYIYNKLLDSNYFDEVMMSASINFNSEQFKYPVVCELDGLVLKDNTLLLISIKSSNVDTDALNEIKLHNLVFGNKYSKAVICLNDELNLKRPSIYAKAEELDIKIIDETTFHNKNVAQEILAIINNEYRYEKI